MIADVSCVVCLEYQIVRQLFLCVTELGHLTELGHHTVLAVRRLTAKSHEVTKPRDCMLLSSHRSDILQASRQHCCRGASQISELLKKSKPGSRGFETSRDLAVRRPSAWWIEAQRFGCYGDCWWCVGKLHWYRTDTRGIYNLLVWGCPSKHRASVWYNPKTMMSRGPLY